MSKTLKELIGSADPLSDLALKAVMGAGEENSYIDYKLEFESDQEREWLELTKDVMAFANTDGGYLAFGVKNGTFEVFGIADATVKVLSDTNNLMLKLNRHVEPEFGALRAKNFQQNGKNCVVVFIPPSLGHTHVFSADGSFKQPSGLPKVVYRQGTFYVRRSGANHLADARDLDAVITRRMEHYRATLLAGITRVMDAPPNAEILVFSQKGERGAKKFVIENAPDAIGVKGMSFSVSPETTEQEIAAWIAMTAKNPDDLPSSGTVWKWYRERKGLQLTDSQRVRVAAYSVLHGAPVFFWLRGCNADHIKSMLVELLDRKLAPDVAADILTIAAFLGKRFHRSVVGKLGRMAERVNPRDMVYPVAGPRSLFESSCGPRLGKLGTQGAEVELNSIVASSRTSESSEPALQDRWRAQRLDGYLYAQSDEYVDAPRRSSAEAGAPRTAATV